MSQMPVARKEGLVIQEMTDETLVYDLETNKAHCLNQTSAAIWKACDGRKSMVEISELLGKDVPEDLVWLAIDQLSEKNLLKEKMFLKVNGQSRREVIKKIGLAAVIALPLVTSIHAKTSSALGTCPTGSCTGNPTFCGTGCTCDNGVCVATP